MDGGHRVASHESGRLSARDRIEKQGGIAVPRRSCQDNVEDDIRIEQQLWERRGCFG
jgi:hypothetical protein